MIGRLSRILNKYPISITNHYFTFRFSSQTNTPSTPIIDRDSRPCAVELSRPQYHKLSEITLQSLLGKLESFIENTNINGSDVEYSNGVLTLKLGKHGTFVLNKQPPNQQIWLSSPVSGPKRFDYCGEQYGWISLRDQVNLVDLVRSELKKLTNILLE